MLKLRLPTLRFLRYSQASASPRGISIIGAIIGELFAESSRVGVGGLGYSIQYATARAGDRLSFRAGVCATILGISFFFIMMFLEWYFLHNWHESARAPETE